MKLKIYTDGALRRRKNLLGAWCYLLLEPEKAVIEAKIENAANITNNRMEVSAVINALKACPKNSEVELFTDSQYVVYGAAEGIQKTNTDLWRQFNQVIKENNLDLNVTHVYGHQDNQGNNAVDLTMRHMLDMVIKKTE